MEFNVDARRRLTFAGVSEPQSQQAPGRVAEAFLKCVWRFLSFRSAELVLLSSSGVLTVLLRWS